MRALGSAKRKHTLVDQLTRRLPASPEEIEAVLGRLEARGDIIRTRKGRVALPSRLGMVTGRLSVGRRGRAVVRPEHPGEGGEVVSLGRHGVRPAMDGDLVLVEVLPYLKRGRPTGRLARVIERGRERITAVVSDRDPAQLVPTDPKIDYTARLSAGAEPAPQAEVVECEITAYPTSYRDLELRPLRPLGQPGELATEIEAVCSMMAIATEFPGAAVDEAEACSEPGPGDIEGRLDLRPLAMFTIDPADAADHDDAVGIEKTGDGWRLTVAIADVSHYVRPGSALDEEARRRTTSTYFPGRAVHMLPEALAAGAASLVPGRDRLTMSVSLEIDPEGRPLSTSFAKSVIRSRANVSYEEAQAILDGPESNELGPSLLMMQDCASRLRTQRMARGAIDLDIPEALVELDGNGRPQTMRQTARLMSHRMIEEFMLAANEAVARHITSLDRALLYRNHERPDEESIIRLAARLSLLGLRLAGGDAAREPAALQAVVKKAAGKPFERLANLMVLRAMTQARYSAERAIHFGLASQCYTHFTSPIRRYPDIITHRALAATFGNRPEEAEKASSLPELALLCSQGERRATGAERDIRRAAGVMIMVRHVGKTFRGTVTSVERFGFFVELDDFFVEGLVPLARLEEYYDFHRERLELKSRESGRTVKVGQRLTVRVTSAELAERSLELEPLT